MLATKFSTKFDSSPFKVCNRQERNNDHAQLLEVKNMSLECLLLKNVPCQREDEDDEDGDDNTVHDCDDDD